MNSPNLPFIRLAMPREASAIATIQHDIWARTPLTAPFLDAESLTDITDAWLEAIIRPPMAHYRVLVAIQPDATPLGRVVGFAAVGPADDLDVKPGTGSILELLVDPAWRYLGHGSRLLSAAIQTLKADGYQYACWWLNSTEDQFRQWVQQSGWIADGGWRELADDTGHHLIKQIRLVTAIDPSEPTGG